MKRKLTILISAIVAVMFIIPTLVIHANSVGIVFNGVTFYDDDKLLIDGVSYVPLRNCLGDRLGYEVDWRADTKTAYIRATGLDISCREGESYMIANGRYLSVGAKNIIREDRMYIPLRPLAKALGGDVKWDANTKYASVNIVRGFIQNGNNFYNENDVYWLSRIINAESRGEPLKGKIAVGNVVLNRVRSANFPNNIKDVIFDTKFGVQFSPVSNGTIYNEPSDESIIAAKICLDGYSVTNTALYFINDSLASNHWVSENCMYVMSIGSHDFYA